jgi:CMP-N-acetylneuraminic acid synthetase
MPCKWNTFVSLSAENEVSHPAANPEPTHRLNGSVYTIWTGILRSQRTFVPPGCQAYEMPAYLSVDIDTYEDFTSAERALSSGQVAQLGELPKPC